MVLSAVGAWPPQRSLSSCPNTVDAAWHESGKNLSLSEELGACEEAEGAEHWRHEDITEGSREAGPPL